MTRGRSWARIVLVVVGLAAMTTFGAFAVGLDRMALWQVVRVCIADYKLAGAPFPCLRVDLSGGDERGDVVLRPPLLHDMILAPTRKVVGVEDPFLQSPDAPNYFEAAWRARSLLESAGGRGPDWDEVGLVVNPAIERNQDQLHIHVGCLLSYVKLALAAAAPDVPIGEWEQLPEVVTHLVFWGTRVRGTDLADVEPFRMTAEALADKVRDRAKLTIMVAGVRVAGEDGFLILASYADAPHSWWPVSAEDLLAPECPAEPGVSG